MVNYPQDMVEEAQTTNYLTEPDDPYFPKCFRKDVKVFYLACHHYFLLTAEDKL